MARSTVRNVELAYDMAGEGPTVVWGHGLSSCRANENDFGVLDWARLGATGRLVRYDARGHGDSGFTAEPAGYAWDELARDQLALLDNLGIHRYTVAGASMGCGTALHVALLAPERIEAMVLLIPPTAWETRRARVEIWEQVAALIEDQGIDAFAAAMAAMPLPEPFRGRVEWRESFERNARGVDPVRLAGVFRGAGTADLPERDRIRTITVPTRILAWSGDPGHPTSTAEELAELLPNAELDIASTWDQFCTWTEHTLDFLARH